MNATDLTPAPLFNEMCEPTLELVEPPVKLHDLQSLAEKCTNAIANCEPTDWQENYAAILAVLERHL